MNDDLTSLEYNSNDNKQQSFFEGDTIVDEYSQPDSYDSMAVEDENYSQHNGAKIQQETYQKVRVVQVADSDLLSLAFNNLFKLSTRAKNSEDQEKQIKISTLDQLKVVSNDQSRNSIHLSKVMSHMQTSHTKRDMRLQSILKNHNQEFTQDNKTDSLVIESEDPEQYTQFTPFKSIVSPKDDVLATNSVEVLQSQDHHSDMIVVEMKMHMRQNAQSFVSKIKTVSQSQHMLKEEVEKLQKQQVKEFEDQMKNMEIQIEEAALQNESHDNSTPNIIDSNSIQLENVVDESFSKLKQDNELDYQQRQFLEEQVIREIRQQDIMDQMDQKDVSIIHIFSPLYDFICIIMSVLFIILAMTECDITNQQKVGQIMSDLFDNVQFDGTNTRTSINTPAGIYSYLQNFYLPLIYDEVDKALYNNPYLTQINNLDDLQNSREHYINNFNYFCGGKFRYRRQKWLTTTNKKDDIVFPQRQNKLFNNQKVYEEQTSDLAIMDGSSSNQVYHYQKNDGTVFNGGYEQIYLGDMTYKEAMATLNNTYNAGWFDDQMLYFSTQALFYNTNYQFAGYYTFEFIWQNQGTLSSQPSIYYTVYPTTYQNLNKPKVVIRLVGYLIFTIYFAFQIFLDIFDIAKRLRTFIRTKQIDIPWSIYMEAALIYLVISVLEAWYFNFSRRNLFQLPLETDSYDSITQLSINNTAFLRRAPFAVFIFLMKDLLILTNYFPTFGVLFDTVEKSKAEFLSFLILVLTFFMGFSVTAYALFGTQSADFNTFSASSISLFQLIMTNSYFDEINQANPKTAIIFYIPFVVLFLILLMKLFLTITINVYDNIRAKQQLKSEAMVQIIMRNFVWKLILWKNLLLCKLDKRSKEEVMDNIEIDQDEYAQITRNEETSLKSIFLYNKTKLWQSYTEVKTTEQEENEITKYKKIILTQKKIQQLKGVMRFRKTDIKFSGDLISHMKQFAQSSDYYNSDTRNPFIDKSQLPNISTGYTIDPSYVTFNRDNGQLANIDSVSDMQQWLLNKCVYYFWNANTTDNGLFNQNFFFGDQRARITIRRINEHQQEDIDQNRGLQYMKRTIELKAEDEVHPEEIKKDIKGLISKNTYKYTQSETLKSFAMKGGVVIYLDESISSVNKTLYEIYQDQVFNSSVATIVVEFLNYNPNYQRFIHTYIQFMISNSGLDSQYNQAIIKDNESRCDRLLRFFGLNQNIFLQHSFFFYFSPKLSVFTEILNNSKNDILYFMVIFVTIVIGYTSIIYCIYGENLSYCNNYISIILVQFEWMNFAFDQYSEMQQFSSLSPFIFISQMIIVSVILLNMIVAIIMSNYEEFAASQHIIVQFSRKQSGKMEFNFIQMLFVIIKELAMPQQTQSKNWFLKNWISLWIVLDNYIIPKRDIQGEKDLKFEIDNLKKELSNKYFKPFYENNENHPYLKPYLNTIGGEQQFTEVQYETEEALVDGNNQFIVTDQALEFKSLSKKPKTDRQLDYENLNLGITNQVHNKQDTNVASLDDKTSSVIWAARLEDELYQLSDKQLLYSDLLDYCAKIGKEGVSRIYELSYFNQFQVKFYSLVNFQQKLKMWENANIMKKYELWELMDFVKVFEDTNTISKGEKLQDLNEYWIKSKNGEPTDSKPVLTFKKINKSPEYSDIEFSRSSDLQRKLWINHTTSLQKYDLWFNKFDSYQKVKLWNKLQFSEDYILNVMNTQQLSRQDICLFILKSFMAIRNEQLRDQKEMLIYYKNILYQTTCRPNFDEIALKASETNEIIRALTKKEKRLQDLIKVMPTRIRDKYINCDFYLKIWDMLQEQEYNQLQGKQIKMVLEGLDIREGANGEEEFIANANAEIIKNNGQTIIDKYDIEGEKEVDEELYNKLKVKNDKEKQYNKNVEQAALEFMKEKGQGFKSNKWIDILNSNKTAPDVFKPKAKVTRHRVPNKAYIDAQTQYVRLMLNGFDGQLQQKLDLEVELLRKEIPSIIEDHEEFKDAIQQETQKLKHFYLQGIFDQYEERLQLWIPLTIDEKLNMLAAQHIDSEASLMSMMILEDIDWVGSGRYRLENIEHNLERSLDNQQYEKYQKYADYQALEHTCIKLDQALEEQNQYDIDLFRYMDFLAQQYKKLESNKEGEIQKVKNICNTNKGILLMKKIKESDKLIERRTTQRLKEEKKQQVSPFV